MIEGDQMNKEKKLTKEKLMELTQKVSDSDFFIDLHTFNDEMMISQVVRFFNKQGRQFTKTMIQNYVRIGVLPPPVDKRYYTRNHLILLTLIDNLKSIYSLEEIKQIFTPILKSPDTFDDDMIKVVDLYEDYQLLYKKALTDWNNIIPTTFEEVYQMIEKDEVKDSEEDVGVAFMMVLTLMAQTIALKKVIHLIAEDYLTNN